MSFEGEIPSGDLLEGPRVVKLRKLDIPVTDSDSTDFIISSEENFDSAFKIAHAYSKDYVKSQLSVETFKKIGSQISQDFQFTDQGGGINTLAGQLSDNNTGNRDCKLPTFLLGLVWKELNPSNPPDIVFLNSNTAHPYVRLKIGGEAFFGHFVKPSGSGKRSQFEFLDEAQTRDLANFIARERAAIFPVDSQAMKVIDELFLNV